MRRTWRTSASITLGARSKGHVGFQKRKSPHEAGLELAMTWLAAVALRPLIALVLLGLFCLPARLAVQRWMPDGPIKRLLLREIGRKRVAGKHAKR
jgi:hypothetical protein